MLLVHLVAAAVEQRAQLLRLALEVRRARLVEPENGFRFFGNAVYKGVGVLLLGDVVEKGV